MILPLLNLFSFLSPVFLLLLLSLDAAVVTQCLCSCQKKFENEIMKVERVKLCGTIMRKIHAT
jgi:hypothetical protein